MQPILISHHHREKIIISIILAAFVYLVAVIYLGYQQVLDAFVRIGLEGWLLLFLFSFTSYSIRYLRWQFYLGQHGHHLPHRLHFLYYLSAFALTTTPGKAGETIRSVLLRPHGVSYHTSLACFLIERFLDLVIVTLLSFLVFMVYEEYIYFTVTFMALLLMVFPVIRFRPFQNLLSTFHVKHKISRIGRFVGHFVNLLQYASRLLSSRILYAGFGLGLIAWGIQGLAFIFILHLLNFDIYPAVAMGIYAVSLLAGAVSFIPGGIGSTELVMGLLLSKLGADNTVFMTAPLISRLSTLWFAVIVGLFAATGINFVRQKLEGAKK